MHGLALVTLPLGARYTSSWCRGAADEGAVLAAEGGDELDLDLGVGEHEAEDARCAFADAACERPDFAGPFTLL